MLKPKVGRNKPQFPNTAVRMTGLNARDMRAMGRSHQAVFTDKDTEDDRHDMLNRFRNEFGPRID